MKRYCLAAMLLTVAMVSVACGTARLDLKTDVLSSGEVDQGITLRGSGLIGAALEGAFDISEARSAGWNVERTTEGGDLIIRMTKRLKKGEPWAPPSKSTSGTGQAAFQSEVDFQVNEGLLDREYRLHITIPASAQLQPTPTPTGTAGQSAYERSMAQLGEQLAKTMFRMSWTINLPGEVVETNADSRTKTGGTWEIGIDQLQKGLDIRIVSRERRDLTPFAVGGIVILVIAGFAVYWMRRQRRQLPAQVSGVHPPQSPAAGSASGGGGS